MYKCIVCVKTLLQQGHLFYNSQSCTIALDVYPFYSLMDLSISGHLLFTIILLLFFDVDV